MDTAALPHDYRDPFDLPAPDPRVTRQRIVRASGCVARIINLAHDTREVVVLTDAAAPPLFARAGQFVVLRVDGVGGPRPFSLARAPSAEAAGEHSFLIRLVPGGAFSNWLAGSDRTGERVDLAGPLGSFVLDESDDPMLCIAGGSGLSAIRALLEEAAIAQRDRDAWLFYGVQTQADLCLVNELRSLSAAWHPGRTLKFVPVLSHEDEASNWQGARGMVTDQVAADLSGPGNPEVAQLRAYLCGPPPMITAAHRLLAAAGVEMARIYTDVFDDASSKAPVIDNQRCVLCDECLLVKPLDNCIVEAALDLTPEGRVIEGGRVKPAVTSGLYYNSLVIDPEVCIRCNACVSVCPHGAISVGFEGEPALLRTAHRGAGTEPQPSQ